MATFNLNFTQLQEFKKRKPTTPKFGDLISKIDISNISLKERGFDLYEITTALGAKFTKLIYKREELK